jgi:hypothetical protein
MRTNSNKEPVSYWIGSLAKITNDGSFYLPGYFKDKAIIYGIITGRDDVANEFLVTLVDKENGDTYSGCYIPCSFVECIASISEIIDMFTDNSYNYFN